MSAEENKAVVRRLWEEVWNQNKLDVCDEIFDTEYAAHEKGFAPVLRAAFPDIHFEVLQMVAEDDRVVSHYMLTGTHQGDFMGIPATGNRIEVKTIWIHRLEKGRIVEGQKWGVWDSLAMMQQLGMTLAPASSSDG